MTHPPDVSNGLVPAVFLDRDGTIMRDVDYCSDPKQVEIFTGVREALRRLKSSGYKLIVITNQSGIGRGYFDENAYRAVEREIARQLGDDLIDATYFCADAPDAATERRKPAPGMIWEAQRAHDIDLRGSFLIGDKPSDIDCGRSAGVRTILVQSGHGSTAADCGADFIAHDFVEAAEMVVTGAK